MSFSFLSAFIKDVENIPGEVAGFFSTHQTQIHTAIADAQTAASAGITVATVVGQPGIAAAIAGVSAGLTQVNTAVTAAAKASTLQEQANNLATLANGLITSGAVGVKNAATQTALTNTVDAVVAKTNTVVGALVTAAVAVSAPPAAA